MQAQVVEEFKKKALGENDENQDSILKIKNEIEVRYE
jgi:hypothetical protein